MPFPSRPVVHSVTERNQGEPIGPPLTGSAAPALGHFAFCVQILGRVTRVNATDTLSENSSPTCSLAP